MDGITEYVSIVKQFAEAGTAVVAFLLAAAGMVVGGAWRQKYKVRKKRAGRVSKRIANIPELYERLNRITIEAGSERGMLMVAENGSAVFPTYATIVCEVISNAKLDSIKKYWQRARIDKAYKMAIGRAVNTDQDYELVHTDELPPGMLRDSHLADDITQTIIVPIRRSHCDDWSVYLSLHMKKDEPLTPKQSIAVRAGAARIRQAMRDFLPE